MVTANTSGQIAYEYTNACYFNFQPDKLKEFFSINVYLNYHNKSNGFFDIMTGKEETSLLLGKLFGGIKDVDLESLSISKEFKNWIRVIEKTSKNENEKAELDVETILSFTRESEIVKIDRIYINFTEKQIESL